jgi:O-antigen/teichoic acid export membrane protein
MYAYLTPTSDPTIESVFGRSIKLAVACLLPIGVLFGSYPDQLLTTIFGDEFSGASDSLQLLAGAIPLMGIVILCSTFIVSRWPSRALVALTGSIALLNIGLNLALIPEFDQDGAAAAMLISELLFALGGLVIAYRQLDGFEWVNALVAPVIAGAAMLAFTEVMQGSAWLVGPAALVLYAAVFVAVERVFSPDDFRFARELVAGRLGSSGVTPMTLEERE